MEAVGAMLAARGLTLRSGGTRGADTAFEWGAHQKGGKCEVFLPWRRFNGHHSRFFMPPEEAEQIAALCHPNWRACDAVSRRFHARNSEQILGAGLDEPVDFVVFWAIERYGRINGGTATAITLARQLEIPTFNLPALERDRGGVPFDRPARESSPSQPRRGSCSIPYEPRTHNYPPPIMLILTRKEGETVLIGDDIAITISRIERDQVRLCFKAPREVVILREELLARMAAEGAQQGGEPAS